MRVPVPLEIGDEGRAETAIGLVARIGAGIAAEEIERLLPDAERAPVADGADRARIGEPLDYAIDGRVHGVARRDLVADQTAVRAVADELALVLNRLARNTVAGEARHAQIREARDDALLAGRQRQEGIIGRKHVIDREQDLAMA